MKVRIFLNYSGCIHADVEVENENEIYQKKEELWATITSEEVGENCTYDDYTWKILKEGE